jgi:hypothetical protein
LRLQRRREAKGLADLGGRPNPAIGGHLKSGQPANGVTRCREPRQGRSLEMPHIVHQSVERSARWNFGSSPPRSCSGVLPPLPSLLYRPGRLHPRMRARGRGGHKPYCPSTTRNCFSPGVERQMKVLGCVKGPGPFPSNRRFPRNFLVQLCAGFFSLPSVRSPRTFCRCSAKARHLPERAIPILP